MTKKYVCVKYYATMFQFEWKPRKKELHIPYELGDFVIQFKRDSHNRKWIISSPNLPPQKIPYILTEGRGDTVIEFLDKIRKAITTMERFHRELKEYEGTPWYFDYQDYKWKIGLFYDPSLCDYSNELQDKIKKHELKMYRPFFTTTQLRKKLRK